MKRKLLTIGLLSTLLFVGLAKGASSGLVDFIENLGENILFGYITDTIDVDEITTSKVVFQSPFITNGSGNKITKYRVMYSQNSLEEMEDDTNLLEQSKEKQFTITDTSPSTFKMELIATGDQLSGNEIYYALVIPEDNDGIFGELSNEICFKLSTRIYGEGSDCVNGNGSNPDDHNAGGADMTLANISFTRNGNTITLRWIALDGSDEIELFLYDRDNEDYTELGTVDMADEEFSFTTNENGEHRVKFIPDNGGTEKIYTFQVTGISPGGTPGPSEPGVPNVPKVGPRENIIAVLIFTFIVYLVYRRAKRQS